MRSTAPLLLAAALLPASCGTGIELDGNKVVAKFESKPIPLLPAGFPVYPKAFSSESITELVDTAIEEVTYSAAVDSFAGDICASVATISVCLDDLLGNPDYNLIDETINEEVPEIRSWVTDQIGGQLRFYNPGPLGMGVGEQVSQAVSGVVSFDAVTVTMKVRNRTNELWGVPVRFSLYMGDSEGVMRKTALLKAADAPAEETHTVLLQPGESREIVVDVPQLADALSRFRSLAIDYDAVVEVADLQPETFKGWLSAPRGDGDGNGVADALATWGVVFDELTITVSGQGELEIPVDFPSWMNDMVPQ